MKNLTIEQQRVCPNTCPGCPLRNAQKKTLAKEGIAYAEALAAGQIMEHELESIADINQPGRIPWPRNAVEKCARMVLNGHCGTYISHETGIGPILLREDAAERLEEEAVLLREEMQASGLQLRGRVEE